MNKATSEFKELLDGVNKAIADESKKLTNVECLKKDIERLKRTVDALDKTNDSVLDEQCSIKEKMESRFVTQMICNFGVFLVSFLGLLFTILRYIGG